MYLKTKTNNKALPVEILDVEVVNVGSPAKEKSRFMDRMKTNFGKLIGKKDAPVGPAPISRHATVSDSAEKTLFADDSSSFL